LSRRRPATHCVGPADFLFSFFWKRVPPRQRERFAQFLDRQRIEFRRGRTACAPGVGNGRESLGRDLALERLLVGREHQIGGKAVRGERRVDPFHLEGGAIEMRRLDRAVERKRNAPKVPCGRHDTITCGHVFRRAIALIRSCPRKRAPRAFLLWPTPVWILASAGMSGVEST
jgi:hypothetical protein